MKVLTCAATRRRLNAFLDRELPVARFEIAIPGGRLRDDPAKPGAANLVAEMLTRGTKKRSRIEFENALKQLGDFRANELSIVEGLRGLHRLESFRQLALGEQRQRLGDRRLIVHLKGGVGCILFILFGQRRRRGHLLCIVHDYRFRHSQRGLSARDADGL